MTISVLTPEFFNVVALIAITLLWLRIRAMLTASSHGDQVHYSLVEFTRARPLFELEMERARRLQYKLAVITISETGDQGGSTVGSKEGGGGQLEDRVVDAMRSTSILRDTLRMTDIASYDADNHQVVVMLPGLDGRRARQTINRIRSLLGLESRRDLQFGCAEFPGDGLLLDDLITFALTPVGLSETVHRVHRGLKYHDATN